MFSKFHLVVNRILPSLTVGHPTQFGRFRGLKTLRNPEEHFEPLSHPDYFNVHNLFTVSDLFNARVHLGHKIGTLHPAMVPYLLGSRLGHCIIDLDQTKQLLFDALNFTAHIASRKGIILFINRSRQTGFIVEKLAQECGEYSHCRDYYSGTLLDPVRAFDVAPRLPDLIIFLGTNDSVFEQHKAVSDAAKVLIPTIGIVDSSCDPRLITYPVPGNDDTPASIEFYCKVFKEAVLRGKKESEKLK